jgi:hypothetical protein
MRRRQLNRPEGVANDDVRVQTPSEALVEALGLIDIGDGHRHDLELHVDRPHFGVSIERSALVRVPVMLTSSARFVLTAASG